MWIPKGAAYIRRRRLLHETLYVCNLNTCYFFSMASLIYLGEMLINYFGNSSISGIYIKKSLKVSNDRKNLLNSKFPEKC